MISIHLDAGLRPVSFYSADDEAPAAVLACWGWGGDREEGAVTVTVTVAVRIPMP